VARVLQWCPAHEKAGTVNILVLEDEAAIRKTIAASLRSCGHEVAVAETGLDGLACVDAHRPDLVVLDLNLPVMSGFEFLRAFRSRLRCAEIPVLVVTAEHGIVPTKIGAQAWLAKPFDLDELLETAERLLRTQQAAAANRASFTAAGERESL
jgi:DNA-binding response OmpR family regulator